MNRASATVRAALRAIVLAVCAAAACAAQAGPPPRLRLYVLDCGHASFKDFAAASDTGETDGRPAELADPCFLIRHPAGWMLWDAGLPARLPGADSELGERALFDKLGMRMHIDVPLVDQLAALHLAPTDIRYLAFSHLHFDHVGAADAFAEPATTWILNRDELAWALAEPAHVSMAAALIAGRARASVREIDGDLDVYGDGSVRILKAPGHTPGSSVLLVTLPRCGPVILSGDLYLTQEGRRRQFVPTVNADRAATLASMQRIERIARRLHARVIVQHDPRDFERLPKAPAFLD